MFEFHRLIGSSIMSKEKSLVEKKLRGSGGYAIAKVSDDEQKMANLGGPELFLAGIGKMDNDRFKKYYCNRCEKEYEGAPNIEFENPNEDLGENIILVEKGEYKCKTCNYIIAQYRKFNESKGEEKQKEEQEQHNNNDEKTKDLSAHEEERKDSKSIGGKEIEEDIGSGANSARKQESQPFINTSTGSRFNSINNIQADNTKSSYVQIEKIVGMLTYDHNAQLVGKVNEIGLRIQSEGKVEFCFKIKGTDNNSTLEISWNNISKIGDIIILVDKNSPREDESSRGEFTQSNSNSSSNGPTDGSQPNPEKSDGKICGNCNFRNEEGSMFCEECGKKLE